MYIYIISICIIVYMCIYICIFAYIYIYSYLHIYIYIYTDLCIYIHIIVLYIGVLKNAAIKGIWAIYDVDRQHA